MRSLKDLDGLGMNPDYKHAFCATENHNEFPCNLQSWEVVGIGFLGALLCFSTMIQLFTHLKGHGSGNDKMKKLSNVISEGTKLFLKSEYSYFCYFVAIITIVLLIVYSLYFGRVDAIDGVRIWSCFVAGCLSSALAGWFGISAATDANSKTVAAIEKSGLNAGLKVAFTGAAVMGFSVVGFGLAVLGFFLCMMELGRNSGDLSLWQNFVFPVSAVKYQWACDSLAGFGFGASSVALFSRIGGSIFAKAASISTELIAKEETNLPENSKNPAIIVNNIGENVVNVAGYGSDLFETYVCAIIAAVSYAYGDVALMTLPFWISGTGAVASIIGYFFVYADDNASSKDLVCALYRGMYVAAIIIMGVSIIICWGLFPHRQQDGWNCFGCIVIGCVSGIIINMFIGHFTCSEGCCVQTINNASKNGSAANILQGVHVGLVSTVGPMFILCVLLLSCNALAGGYGIAIAAVGMLSPLAMLIATNSFVPIAKNACNIANMTGQNENVRKVTDTLDTLGNASAAIAKGYATSTAVVTSFALLIVYQYKSGMDLHGFNMADPLVFAGVIFGGMLPFVIAGLTITSIKKAANSLIEEVKRQLHTNPGLIEGTSEPETNKCVENCTEIALQEILLPSTYAITAPIFVGFLVGPRCLGGFLGGAICSGGMLAIMLTTTGSSLNNAKGNDIASSVADSLKDAAGPSINVVIKLISIVSVAIAPIISNEGDWKYFGYGFIPLGVAMIITIYYYYAVYNLNAEPKDYNQVDTNDDRLSKENAKNIDSLPNNETGVVMKDISVNV